MKKSSASLKFYEFLVIANFLGNFYIVFFADEILTLFESFSRQIIIFYSMEF